MLLTKDVEYAVAILKEVKLSTSPTKIANIASKHSLSSPFLEQVARKLRKAGYITSVRGPGGGYVAGDKLNGTVTLLALMDTVKRKTKKDEAFKFQADVVEGQVQEAQEAQEAQAEETEDTLSPLQQQIQEKLAEITVA